MALSDEQIRELWENYSRTQGIASFAHSVEAEVRKQDTELIRKMLDVWLPLHAGNYKLTKTDAAVVNATINAARARLKE